MLSSILLFLLLFIEFNEAFKCQEIVVNSFSRLLSASKDDNWLLPVMQVWIRFAKFFIFKDMVRVEDVFVGIMIMIQTFIGI